MKMRFSNFERRSVFLSLTLLNACGIIIKYHIVWKYMRSLSKDLEEGMRQGLQETSKRVYFSARFEAEFCKLTGE